MANQFHRNELRGLQGDTALANIPLQQRVLLRTLATGLERQLDLAGLVSQVASDFTGYQSRLQHQLAQQLAASVPLTEALSLTPGVLDPAIVVAITLAEREGRTAELLRELVDKSNQSTDANSFSARGSLPELARSILGILFATFLMTFLTLFILPTLEKIVDEFGLRLPVFCTWVFHNSFLFPLIAMLIVIMLFVLVFVNAAPLLGAVLNRFSPYAWQTLWISGRTKLLSLLAMVERSSLTLPHGLQLIGEAHPDHTVRGKVRAAAVRVAQGQDPYAALACERLLTRSECQSLQLAETNSARSWLLKRFASRRALNSSERLWWMFRATSLVCHVMLGLVVTLYALSMFLFLVSLISGLS